LAGKPFVQAGGQNALGGQVIFRLQDPQRGAFVEQLPDPGGEGELSAGIAAAAPAVRCGLAAPAASRARKNACRTLGPRRDGRWYRPVSCIDWMARSLVSTETGSTCAVTSMPPARSKK
jgi:hypothetical protein